MVIALLQPDGLTPGCWDQLMLSQKEYGLFSLAQPAWHPSLLQLCKDKNAKIDQENADHMVRPYQQLLAAVYRLLIRVRSEASPSSHLNVAHC